MNFSAGVKVLHTRLKPVFHAMQLYSIAQPAMRLRRHFDMVKVRTLLALEHCLYETQDKEHMCTQELLWDSPSASTMSILVGGWDQIFKNLLVVFSVYFGIKMGCSGA